MRSFHQFGNFAQPRSYAACFKVSESVLRYLNQLPCSNIESYKGEAGHDSGNRDAEGDRRHVI